ncbi:MAG TPA: hypothetical protein VGO68_05165 [Pyrinomonadaceae bacterium]|jgi:hypothetical protein|nr:hypothetical protein [Pyrinomonadaceae bacterium]
MSSVPSGNSFWKPAIFAIVLQFVVCLAIWIFTFILPAMADRLMEAMFYFYWPTIALMSLVGITGEFGPFLAGIMCSWFLYSALFGAIMVAIKSLNSR